MAGEFVLQGKSSRVVPIYRAEGIQLEIDGEPVDAVLEELGDGEFLLEIDGDVTPLRLATDGDATFIHDGHGSFRIDAVNSLERASEEAAGVRGADQITAPMPGVVVEVIAGASTRVAQGDTVLTIESMKLETAMTAPRDGVVAAVLFEAGASFEKGSVLVTLEPLEEASSS